MFSHGKKFIKSKNKFNKKYIKKNTISIDQPDLDNVLKSQTHSKFIGREGYQSLNEANQKYTNARNELESNYMTTLDDWEDAYKAKSSQTRDDSWKKPHVVFQVKDDSASTKYYMDSNGYKRKFADDTAWTTKSANCPNRVTNTISQDEFDSIKKTGAAMYGYIPCRKGGYNIEYNGQYAFITEDGKMRLYKDWSNRDESCKNLQTIDFSDDSNGQIIWDNYSLQTGPELINSDPPTGQDCKLGTGMNNDLTTHNNKLKTHANIMRSNINNIISTRVNLEKKIGGKHTTESFTNVREGWEGSYKDNGSCQTEKCKLLQKIKELQEKRKEINKTKGHIATYDSKIDESKLSVSSVQMHHLIWMVLGGTFALTAIINS